MSGVMAPTYQSGFASPQRGRMKYPSLWHGCDGAWNPSLGPTGLTLRDWSGRGNHGTLTNTTADAAWTINGGSRMLLIDGTNDYIATGWNPTTLRGSGYACSMSCWVQQSASATRQFVYGVGGAPRWYVFIEATSRIVFVGIGSQAISTLTLFPSSGLHHLGFTKVGTTLKVFLDGKLNSTSNYTGDNTVPNLSIPLGAQDNGLVPINGYLGDIMTFNRCLSDTDMMLLGSRQGIAYEMAPRRRASIQVPGFKAAWLNQRSQIIGGGLK